MTQYDLSAADLELILALARARTLAGAGERLRVDPSTVFRSLQRLERGVGRRLFDRSRSGYAPSEDANALIAHAEAIEAELEAARVAASLAGDDISGVVRVATTDTILHALIAPALASLHRQRPRLTFELRTGNDLANLSRREADIAVRATREPPAHLVGRQLGIIKMALYAPACCGLATIGDAMAAQTPWIGVDDALPSHPSVAWRKKHYPSINPTYRADSVQSVMELIARGLGIGVLPIFLACARDDVVRISDQLSACETGLWLLTHPDVRRMRRISIVFSHFAKEILLS